MPNQNNEKLTPILGRWREVKKDYTTYEVWKYEKNHLEGLGFVLVEKDTVFKEQIQLKSIYGKWYYLVTLNQSKNVESFKLIHSRKNYWVFENPNNDFPQRIIYQIKNPQWMYVILEGEEQNKDKKVLYKFKSID
jgi:hypothetical protein